MIYLGPVERTVWEEIDKLNAVEVFAEMRARVWELEGLVRFREFERDQAREAYRELKERS
jgi:hypothetical protein